jgi:hypothetical protein
LNGSSGRIERRIRDLCTVIGAKFKSCATIRTSIIERKWLKTLLTFYLFLDKVLSLSTRFKQASEADPGFILGGCSKKQGMLPPQGLPKHIWYLQFRKFENAEPKKNKKLLRRIGSLFFSSLLLCTAFK